MRLSKDRSHGGVLAILVAVFTLSCQRERAEPTSIHSSKDYIWRTAAAAPAFDPPEELFSLKDVQEFRNRLWKLMVDLAEATPGSTLREATLYLQYTPRNNFELVVVNIEPFNDLDRTLFRKIEIAAQETVDRKFKRGSN